MQRILSYIPALVVAIIITSVTTLYVNSGKKIKELYELNASLMSDLSDSNIQIKDLKVKINELERAALIYEQTKKETSLKSPEYPVLPELKNEPPAKADDQKKTLSVNTKIASIAKFVPLSEVQRKRLFEKFSSEFESNAESAESLDDIIGKDNADFYREQRKKAFTRVLEESIDKEILFISRKLELEPAQEELLRKIYYEIEDTIRNNRDTSDLSQNLSQAGKLEKLVLEEKERNRLLSEKVKTILNAEQYNKFTQYQTGNQDMQLWHEH